MSSRTLALAVRELSKDYRIASIEQRHTTLAEALAARLPRPVGATKAPNAARTG